MDKFTEFTSKNQLLLIVVITLGSIFACCFMCLIFSAAAGDTTASSNKQNTSAVEEDKENKENKENKETTPDSEPVVEVKKEYKSVFKFEGSSGRKSEVFSLSGDKAKVVWTLDGDPEYIGFYAYAVPEGKTESWEGESITVFAQESGETILYKKGKYYLDITSANTKWKIEVFDYLPAENK